MKMSNWIGYAVSVNCGEPLGCYQGTILETDGTTITLTKAFRNGFPYPKSKVTLNAADIKDLKIIEESLPAKQTHSTVAVSKNNKKGQRATVCENLQANHSNIPSAVSNQQNASSLNSAHAAKSTNVRGGAAGPTRSKPIDIQGAKSNKNICHSGSGGASGASGTVGASGGAGSTPRGRAPSERARRRNEACFGDEAERALCPDFDFEGNLALFDKQALWEEMRSAARPDVVRGADEAGARLRHDESVLGGVGGAGGGAGGGGGIEVPAELSAGVQYRTEGGALVPGASCALRGRLWGALRGAAGEAALVLLARAAADVALRLVGGGRRLEPANAHQPPVVVALAGAHRLGAAAVLAARLLAAHGARAHALVAGERAAAGACAELQRELGALAAAGGRLAEEAARLPSADLVLLALHEPGGDEGDEGGAEGAREAALAWARGARGAVLALEPPALGWAGVRARASVVALLPGASAPALGRLFLANVAPPPRLFRALGLRYRAPFGAASLLPLHAVPDA